MVQLRSGASTGPTQECHLITGGGGYVGLHLGKALHLSGHRVVLFDVREPADIIPEGVTFIKGDIRSYEDVEKAFAVTNGVDCVYHVASYGMSGREQLNKKLIEEVNITGTQNVIRACREHGVKRLVYTSTYNVVFGGQEIRNGDETLPYLPLDKHPDHYSRTKSIAEATVLGANGTPLNESCSDGSVDVMRTCALRLAGVYGPGEQRHLPRIVSYIERGLFSFKYGQEDSLVEFLHVDNLVQAHVRAGEALSSKKNYIAAGQAYFISDCKPVNNFEFFRPLIEGLGYKYPSLSLPLPLIYLTAFIIEIIHGIVGQIYNFQPLLTRTEVYKTGVTHYFNIGKAKQELGYSPTVQNEMDKVVEWFKQRGHGRDARVHHKKKKHSILVDLILAAVFAAFVLSMLPFVK